MRTSLIVLLATLVVTGCTSSSDKDAVLRTKILGTWTTADVVLPDQAVVSNVRSTFLTDGSWRSQYTVNRPGDSREQTTSGTWQIENGFMLELQTNVDGVMDTAEKPGSSRIMRLDANELVLSNYYSPRRVFIRKQQ